MRIWYAFRLTPAWIPDRITGASGFWFSNCVSLIILSIGMSILLRRTEKKALENPDAVIITGTQP